MDPTVLDETSNPSSALAKFLEEQNNKTPRAGAEAVAFEMGLISQEEVLGDPLKLPGGQLLPPIRGRKALVGQYKQKYKREDGTTGYLDMSEVINASVKGGIKLPIRKALKKDEAPQAS